MKWNLIINGEKVTWRVSDSVAIVPPRDFPHPPPEREKPGDKPAGNGYRLSREELALKTFKRAGWKFIDAKALRAPRNGNGTRDSRDIRQVFTNKRGDILIETDVATLQLNASARTQRRTVEKIIAEDGLTIIQQFSFAPHVYSVRLPSGRPLPETINRLQAKTDRYVFVEPSMLQRISGRQDPNDPQFGDQWQHDDDAGLHSVAAWAISKGTGVRIAIIDTGMDIDHDDLRDGIKGGGYFEYDWPGAATYSFFRYQPGMSGFPNSPHGTACMAMAGARQDNGIEGSGIAPESDLLAIACARDNTGTQETLARAIEYAIDPQQVDPNDFTPGADVISCSLDTFYHVNSVLEMAINSAASGRDGLGVPIFWAVNNINEALSKDKVCSLPDVIAVGRSNEDGFVYRCARGSKLEFLAPGRNLVGPEWNNDDVWSGTSYATPLAAGVAALIMSLYPDWTAEDVLQRLRDTCDMPVHPSSQNDRYGHGRLNAHSAVL